MIPPLKWTKIENASGVQPQSVHGHKAVAVNHLMIIFGGGNEKIVDGRVLHVYDTVKNEWSQPQLKGEIPPGRAAFGFVNYSTRIIAFGGMLEYSAYSKDLYELETINWEWKKLEQKPSKKGTLPCARLGHSFTAVNATVYLFGGIMNETGDPRNNKPRYLNDFYSFKITSKEVVMWTAPITFGNKPSARESHTAVGFSNKDGSDPKLVIYGGMGGGCRLGDLFILHLDSLSWTEPYVAGPKPLPRSLHSATLIGSNMYVFGGWVPLNSNTLPVGTKQWKCSNSLACFNLVMRHDHDSYDPYRFNAYQNTMTWEYLSMDSLNDNDTIPKARAGHCAVGLNNSLYIWSGRDCYNKFLGSQVCLEDLWKLQIGGVQLSAPGKMIITKTSPKALYISWDQVSSATGYLLQIQKLDSSNGTQMKVERSLPPIHPPGTPMPVFKSPSFPIKTCSMTIPNTPVIEVPKAAPQMQMNAISPPKMYSPSQRCVQFSTVTLKDLSGPSLVPPFRHFPAEDCTPAKRPMISSVVENSDYMNPKKEISPAKLPSVSRIISHVTNLTKTAGDSQFGSTWTINTSVPASTPLNSSLINLQYVYPSNQMVGLGSNTSQKAQVTTSKELQGLSGLRLVPIAACSPIRNPNLTKPQPIKLFPICSKTQPMNTRNFGLATPGQKIQRLPSTSNPTMVKYVMINNQSANGAGDAPGGQKILTFLKMSPGKTKAPQASQNIRSNATPLASKAGSQVETPAIKIVKAVSIRPNSTVLNTNQQGLNNLELSGQEMSSSFGILRKISPISTQKAPSCPISQNETRFVLKRCQKTQDIVIISDDEEDGQEKAAVVNPPSVSECSANNVNTTEGESFQCITISDPETLELNINFDSF